MRGFVSVFGVCGGGLIEVNHCPLLWKLDRTTTYDLAPVTEKDVDDSLLSGVPGDVYHNI